MMCDNVKQGLPVQLIARTWVPFVRSCVREMVCSPWLGVELEFDALRLLLGGLEAGCRTPASEPLHGWALL